MIKKLKQKEDSDLSAVETEDSDPQERNLIKSRYHNQSKTIHKEMLKKGKKPASYRRTANGRYEGVPTSDTNDTDDITDEDVKNRQQMHQQVSSSSGELRVRLDESHKSNSNSSLGNFGRGSTLERDSSKLKQQNNSGGSKDNIMESDQTRYVLADVHKTNPTHRSSGGPPEFVSIHTRDRDLKPSNRVGNIYVPPSELKPGAILSTFGQGAGSGGGNSFKTSTPTSSSNPQQSRISPITIVNKNNPPPTNANSAKSEELILNRHHHQQQQPLQSQAGQNDPPPWASPVLTAPMGDILEDPREDDLSAISGSIRSASMYGSSEIFDAAQDPGNTYYNIDSDIDVPPIDSDDIFSDGCIPSPRAFFTGQIDKGRTNDDIKMIPGALKSPGANTGRLVNPRPNSSIILRTDSNKVKTPQLGRNPLLNKRDSASSAGVKTRKESEDSLPEPPPNYEEIVQNLDVFQFPPPPKMFQGNNSASTVEIPADNSFGDYVQIKRGGGDRQGLNLGQGRVGRSGGAGGTSDIKRDSADSYAKDSEGHDNTNGSMNRGGRNGRGRGGMGNA